MSAQTLFDKIWDAHVIEKIDNGPQVLYIDRHYIHEVTSPQAFTGLANRGIKVFRPELTTATHDHNVPTFNQHLPITDSLSRNQVETLTANCAHNGIELYGLQHEKQGIVHVIGPELGLTQPGMTIVCGDSHTSTHGAFGCVAFGIGTSEVEMVLATQCILQPKPKKMRISVNGNLKKGVSSKDIILYLLAKLTSSAGTGYFIEFAGTAIHSLSMEARMTICNMSIELGARGGIIAPDEITFAYLKDREFTPKNGEFDKTVEKWKQLKSDDKAVFDAEYTFDAADIDVMITFGTNPGMGIPINGAIPKLADIKKDELESYEKGLKYMGFNAGEKLIGKKINWIFVGSCTNGRIEDLRAFASVVKGKKKAANVNALIVPGSKAVEKMAIEEGIADVLKEAGFVLRQPGCSACLAMNEDKIPAGEYCIATSNRNFEGRQGAGSRTLLASPITAAASAINGYITDPSEFIIA